MDHPYKYADEVVNTKISSLNAFLGKFSPSRPIIRTNLNEITDLRNKTALLIGKPIGQVYGLTRNWSKEQLRETLRLTQDFKNPSAGFWVLYKKNKTEYGKKKINRKRLPGLGATSRSQEQDTRTLVLF
jgi:hypothetical protein